MASEQDRFKATDYLTESLKLITVISTVLISGILTLHSKLNNINKYFFYAAIFLWLLTFILSVINLNMLINKIYNGNSKAIMEKDVKNYYIITVITLFIGILCGIFFVFFINENKSKNQRKLYIHGNNICIDHNYTNDISIKQDLKGKIKTITININANKTLEDE